MKNTDALPTPYDMSRNNPFEKVHVRKYSNNIEKYLANTVSYHMKNNGYTVIEPTSETIELADKIRSETLQMMAEASNAGK